MFISEFFSRLGFMTLITWILGIWCDVGVGYLLPITFHFIHYIIAFRFPADGDVALAHELPVLSNF